MQLYMLTYMTPEILHFFSGQIAGHVIGESLFPYYPRLANLWL